jgi:polysaccharide biosynthesis/export protein
MTVAGAILHKTVGGGGRIVLVAALLCQIVAVAAASTARPSTPQFHVHAGDVIEVAVAGLPELRMRGSVQPDGVVTFPLFGDLEVAGLNTAQLREAAQNQFAHKIYRLRTNDGREVPVVIQAEEVSASVVEYGPIYIDGDVAKPGAVTFRPGITARQAIALAGGVEIAALRSGNPLAETSAARSELQSINVKLAEAEAQAAGLATELRGGNRLDGFSPQGLDVPAAQMDQIAQDESNVVQARMADYTRQQQFLQASVATITNRTAVLQKQQKAEEEGARADDDDLQKMIELLKRGNVANPRVLEARRALLMSQTRSLQVADGLLQLTMQSADLSRQLQHLQDDHKAELLKEAQETQATLAELKVKRDAARERLNLFAMSRARLSVDQPSSVEVALVRDQRNGKSTRETIDGDYPLEPGDVIEVAVIAVEN